MTAVPVPVAGDAEESDDEKYPEYRHVVVDSSDSNQTASSKIEDKSMQQATCGFVLCLNPSESCFKRIVKCSSLCEHRELPNSLPLLEML